jgi:PAS domain S-box-containing protein
VTDEHASESAFPKAARSAGQSNAARLMAELDWTELPFGTPANWPACLRVALSLCLGSSFPTAIYYGSDFRLIYNDAWAPIAGERHPWCFGRPAAEVWADIWAVVGPQLDDVLRTGNGFATFDQMLPMQRNGRVQETYWNYSFTPVRDDTGAIVAILNQGNETTDRVLGERAQAFRLDLEEHLRELDDPVAVMNAAAERVGRLLGVGRAGYGEIDPSGEVIRVAHDWANTMPSLVGESRLLGGFGDAIAAELRAGMTLIVEDSATDPRADGAEVAATWASIDLQSIVAVPLIRQGQFVAFLYAHEARPRRWTATEIALMQDTAERTWAAVERARAEQALRQSEGKLHAIFASATVGLSEVGPDGRFLRVNEELCRLLDRTGNELLQTNVASVTHRDDVEQTLRAIAEALHHGGTVALDKRYIRPDGTMVFANSRVTPLQEPGGGTNLLAVTVDLSDRIAAEQRLRESEARFRLMADAVPQIVWITDAAGNTEFFNKQWARYTGVEYEPTTAAAVAADHVHPDDGIATMEAFGKAGRLREPFHVEHRIRSASGAYRWFLVRAEPYISRETGEIERWFGASVDIHDRKLAEETLRRLNVELEQQVIERSRELGLFWQQSIDLLSVLNIETGRFEAVNPAWTRALGWAAHELEGSLYADYLHPEDVEASRLAFARTRTGLPELNFENRYRTKHGDWRWLSWVAVPENSKLYSVTHDVTEEKEQRAELQKAQEALRQSQKLEAMGSLTGGVAHDFNNLLTPIIGSLDMLVRKEVGSERERRLIDGALQSAERAKTLVQRLLAFARRQPLQASAVDIKGLVEGMIDLLGSTLGPTIDIRLDLGSNLPPAQADPNQLEMALLNLAVNARDAMPVGGELKITAQTESVSECNAAGVTRGHYIRLCVGDTGIGMDDATLRKAAEPFFSTKGIGKGTGLGLSMVHGLAAQLGGGLVMKSTLGRGTTIELWLPISKIIAEGDDNPPPVAPAVSARGIALLVDDEELVRMTTADMLVDLGFEVVEVAGADAALDLLDDGLTPALVVTDHLMPGLTGGQLARKLKAERPGLPVLIISGYAEADGIDADVTRLTKPFRRAELAQHLASFGVASWEQDSSSS